MGQSVTEGFSITKVDKPSYKMSQKKLLCYLFILLFSLNSLAKEAIFDEKDFFIKLSVDNNLTSSQDASTNLAFSAISGLAYLRDNSGLCDNLLCKVAVSLGAEFISVVNHEISGHAARILEFNGTVTNVKLFSNPPYVAHDPTTLKPQHLQVPAIVSLGGVQANYLLSQKISDHLISRNQKIDPITGIGYLSSITNQLMYNYFGNNISRGHDLNSYVNDMQIMYGDKSMNLDTLKYHGFLSLFDPMLFVSLYSMFTNKSIDIPVLKVNNIGIAPFARSIFTPYASIEKKFGAYILTDYTPIRIGFSIGKQFKGDKPIEPKEFFAEELQKFELSEKLIAQGRKNAEDSYDEIVKLSSSIGGFEALDIVLKAAEDRLKSLNELKKEEDKIKDMKCKTCFTDCKDNNNEMFKGLRNGEAIERHMTYSFDISVFKLFSFDKLNVGATAAFWRQPELFVKDPYREKPKNGFMFTINSSYKASEDFNILCDIGYKSKGFVPGQRINQAFMASLALEYKM